MKTVGSKSVRMPANLMEGTLPLQLITASAAAKILSISQRQIWRLAATEELPIVKIGRAARFDLRDIVELVKRRKK